MKSIWFDTALLPNGWSRSIRMTIDKGLISHLACAASQPGDECHAVALPGLPNCHSHGFQRAMAGLTQSSGAGSDDFWTWRQTMYRFVDRLDPEAIIAITGQAYVEMLESGFTSVGEFHYLHNAPDGSRYDGVATGAQAIAQAACDSGIGLTLLPVFYAHSNFGGADPQPAQRRFLNDTDSFASLVTESRKSLPDDARVGIAPHSLRAVTPNELKSILPLAGDGPIHIHIAEQVLEVEACLAWSGSRPVEWLLNNALVNEQWCCVHATHMSDAETAGLARSGAVAGLCPVTEADLGDGISSARTYLDFGGKIAVGSDSNVLVDAGQELRLLEYGQRLVERHRNVLAGGPNRSTGRRIFDAALTGGGQALGRQTGLSVGAPADFITLNRDHPAIIACTDDQAIDAWIFSAGAAAIDCVWRGGKKWVEGGRHCERERIAARYRRTLQSILRDL